MGELRVRLQRQQVDDIQGTDTKRKRVTPTETQPRTGQDGPIFEPPEPTGA